ncbi:hypothetical protein Ancab_035761, partial [Ancistrocladus abbreviatus]
EKDIESVKDLLESYENSFWTCSISKLGYSGTAIISWIKPISVTYGLGISDHDSEGRLVTAEFDSFYLLSGYVPNSRDGLKTLYCPYYGFFVDDFLDISPTGLPNGIHLLAVT